MKKKASRSVKTKKPAKTKRKAASKPRRKSGLAQMNYSVSPELEAIIGTKKSTRPQIVKLLWVYIKKHKCQDAKNRRMIVPDSKLSEVIGGRPVDMLKLAAFLNKHIKK